MRFIPVTCEQRESMLRAIGASGVDELFEAVPAGARLGRPLDLPDGLTEPELVAHVRGLAEANIPASSMVSFLGAGCYDHYSPAVVDHVLRMPGFYTAYTPYQPEVSQGTLQAIYEFQTMICELTHMDVANASMYDGATALVEAAYLASHETKRSTVVVSGSVHPEWRETLRTYAAAGPIEVVEVPALDGAADLSRMITAVGQPAALVVSDPAYSGRLENLAAVRDACSEVDALMVVAANPMLLSVLEPPGAFGADVVVGEAQSLGIPMSFGGPGLGFFATRDRFLRRMPGRVVGRTVDVDGAEAFVLTMQTREQHIRRERATSNICSNHALAALAACVYLCAVGRDGLAGIARSSIAKAHYLFDSLVTTGRFAAPWDAPFAHEFALRFEGDVPSMQRVMREQGFLAGLDMGALDPADAGLVLFACTEQTSRSDIDRFVELVGAL